MLKRDLNAFSTTSTSWEKLACNKREWKANIKKSFLEDCERRRAHRRTRRDRPWWWRMFLISFLFAHFFDNYQQHNKAAKSNFCNFIPNSTILKSLSSGKWSTWLPSEEKPCQRKTKKFQKSKHVKYSLLKQNLCVRPNEKTLYFTFLSSFGKNHKGKEENSINTIATRYPIHQAPTHAGCLGPMLTVAETKHIYMSNVLYSNCPANFETKFLLHSGVHYTSKISCLKSW